MVEIFALTHTQVAFALMPNIVAPRH